METTCDLILDRVALVAGGRDRITRGEAAAILNILFGGPGGRPVEPNDWCGPVGPGESYGDAWARLIDGVTVVSVLPPEPLTEDQARTRAASSNPGDIRYDEPGSMHPAMEAVVMFAPADLDDATIAYLRRRARRVLLVEPGMWIRNP